MKNKKSIDPVLLEMKRDWTDYQDGAQLNEIDTPTNWGNWDASTWFAGKKMDKKAARQNELMRTAIRQNLITNIIQGLQATQGHTWGAPTQPTQPSPADAEYASMKQAQQQQAQVQRQQAQQQAGDAEYASMKNPPRTNLGPFASTTPPPPPGNTSRPGNPRGYGAGLRNYMGVKEPAPGSGLKKQILGKNLSEAILNSYHQLDQLIESLVEREQAAQLDSMADELVDIIDNNLERDHIVAPQNRLKSISDIAGKIQDKFYSKPEQQLGQLANIASKEFDDLAAIYQDLATRYRQEKDYLGNYKSTPRGAVTPSPATGAEPKSPKSPKSPTPSSGGTSTDPENLAKSINWGDSSSVIKGLAAIIAGQATVIPNFEQLLQGTVQQIKQSK